MKASTKSAMLSIAALGTCSLAAITMDIARNPAQDAKARRRDLLPRAPLSASLANNLTGGNYVINVQVGTPPQQIALAIDTGSSDVWVLDVTTDLCSDLAMHAEVGTGCQTPCKLYFLLRLSINHPTDFLAVDHTKSSSFKIVDPNGFDIQYGDGSSATGDYFTDVLTVGGASLKAQQMGIASNATLTPGLLGIGYDLNEASDNAASPESLPFVYSSIIDSMVTQGLISTKAYSLYLNDLEASTGSIIFGGLDSDKYHGDLWQMPIIPYTLEDGTSIYSEFSVALTSYAISTTPGNTTTLTNQTYTAPVILDSGTSLTLLPEELAYQIFHKFDAVVDEASSITFVDCAVLRKNPQLTFDFGFGGPSGFAIRVPISEIIFETTGPFSLDGFEPDVPFTDICVMGISPQSQEPYILGDTFLRSAYVVYDLKNNLIAMAQTNFNSTTSSIVEFAADATAIPSVSGVASAASATETATGILPIGGGKTSTANPTATNSGGSGSTTATGSSGSSSTASSTRAPDKNNAGVASVPAFDMRGLMVMGMSAAFAVFGAGFTLA
jgi:hypothetical protein